MTDVSRHRSSEDPRSRAPVRRIRMRRADQVLALMDHHEAELATRRRELLGLDSEDPMLRGLISRAIELFGEHAPR